ncbi:MAG: DUF1700 domain-containing protein [Lachnospiraceae bacterium]
MTKYEFLDKMRHALANDLSGPVIQENISYYDSYINDEVRKGRSEEAVTEELGDPWALARTIIESAGGGAGNAQGEYTYEPERQRYGQERQDVRRQVHVFGLDSWWKRLILILGIIGVVMVVVAVIGGIFSLLAPLVVPILIVMLILRIIGGRRR